MEKFKIKVTPERSKVIQEILFSYGVTWFLGDIDVSCTDKPYLFVQGIERRITWGRVQDGDVSDLTELTYEDFMAKYAPLPNKFAVLDSEAITKHCVEHEGMNSGLGVMSNVYALFFYGRLDSWEDKEHRIAPLGYEIITEERFFNNINKMKTTTKTYKVTREQMGKIHKIACSEWKSKIDSIVICVFGTYNNDGELTHDTVESMFKAATDAQKTVLSTIFPTYKEKPVLRPYDASDAKDLIGKVVKHKNDNIYLAITAANDFNAMIGAAWIRYESILELYTFIDGSPCGKK